MAVQDHYPLVSYQPLRLLFQLSCAASVLIRLPYYIAVSLIPAFRPHPTWTAKQTFMTRIVYPFLDVTSRVGITETLTLEPGKEGNRFQQVPPGPLAKYTGPLATESVKPATVGGTWFPSAPSGGDIASKTIFLYIHGGAFIQGDGRDDQVGPIASKLLELGGADAVFSLQYRLSGYGGANPYPAALQDVVSSYLFLLDELHLSAGQIVLAGDSAGANLATAFLLYLHEYGSQIHVPEPKCAVLFSPWVAPFQYSRAGNPHAGTDFIPSSYPMWGAHTYAGSRPDATSDPYITSLGHAFPTRVPIFVNAGSAELFFERITQWAVGMREVEGNVVELNHEDGAVHDTILSGHILGFEASAREVVAKVRRFVRNS